MSMNRTSSFARGHEAQARKAAKVKRRKMLGRRSVAVSAVRKGPAKSEAHLALVRAECCLTCGTTCDIEAHHPREMFPRTMGKRVSDYMAVPLCREGHKNLHHVGRDKHWTMNDTDPLAWIAAFLASTYPANTNVEADEARAIVLARIKERTP